MPPERAPLTCLYNSAAYQKGLQAVLETDRPPEEYEGVLRSNTSLFGIRERSCGVIVEHLRKER